MSCVLTVPAFGPWDDRAATSCSGDADVFELRIPAARGDCPYAPKIVTYDGLDWRGTGRGRISSSGVAFQLPERRAWPAERLACLRVSDCSPHCINEKKTPHHALGAGGAFETLPTEREKRATA
jgi:hypothetical protein